MSKIKNQKGAISLFVMLSMLFFLAFMLGAFSLVNRRNATQVEALKETKEIYSSGASAKDTYDAIVSNSNSVVPISTKEQLAKAIEIEGTTTTANYIVNGKLYTYQKNASYVLQNDIILDLNTELNEKNASSGVKVYDYALYSSKYKIDANGHSIYYIKNDDKSLWKCVFYQNIGTDKKNVFSKDSTREDYAGRSYQDSRFSILDDGIKIYQNKWDNTNLSYEFMLMYNNNNQKFSTSQYNRWRQTNSPVDEKNDSNTAVHTVTGYNDTFTGASTVLSKNGTTTYNNWGGLCTSSSTASYLDGSVGDSGYYYSVGSVIAWGTYGIPVSEKANTTSFQNSASECLLFVRVR